MAVVKFAIRRFGEVGLAHYSSDVLGTVAVGVMLLGAFFAHAIAKRNATQADHA